MTRKALIMRRLRAIRIAAGRCPACETPASSLGYVYCEGCREDAALRMLDARSVTGLTCSSLTVDTVTIGV